MLPKSLSQLSPYLMCHKTDDGFLAPKEPFILVDVIHL